MKCMTKNLILYLNYRRNSPDYNYFEKVAKRYRHLFNFRVLFGPSNSRRVGNCNFYLFFYYILLYNLIKNY